MQLLSGSEDRRVFYRLQLDLEEEEEQKREEVQRRTDPIAGDYVQVRDKARAEEEAAGGKRAWAATATGRDMVPEQESPVEVEAARARL